VKRVHRVFSFSNVVAMLALFLALGGSVYAASSNKINGSKIKPKSIPGNRIKASSLTAAQIKAQTLTGAKVKPGSLTGKQVVGSTLTGVSAAGLAAVNYAVTTVALGIHKVGGTTSTASCPSGQKVIGGGAVLNDDGGASVNDSGPTVSRDGWEATAYTGAQGVSMTVTAICTVVGSIDGQERRERDSDGQAPVYYRGR
jgi:hypothetical protein